MFPCVSFCANAYVTILLVLCSACPFVLTRPTDARWLNRKRENKNKFPLKLSMLPNPTTDCNWKYYSLRIPTHRDTVVMMTLTEDKLLWVVVYVRRKQFTDHFTNYIAKCTQVKRETWWYVDTDEPTLTALQNVIWTNAGDVEIGKLMRLKLGISHSSVSASA